jgi:quercetin dioxygenase-like cupin family protein
MRSNIHDIFRLAPSMGSGVLSAITICIHLKNRDQERAMGFIKHEHEAREVIGEKRERYLGHTDKLMMVVIDFDDGPTSEPDPPHSHPHEQMSYVVSGELIAFIGDEQERLGPGDMFTVPPEVPHSVQLLTSHVRLVDCFTPLREDFLK